MNELLDDVIQECGSDSSAIGVGSREGQRRRGKKGIETNESRKEGK